LKKKTNTIQKTKLKTKIDHDEKALMSPQWRVRNLSIWSSYLNQSTKQIWNSNMRNKKMVPTVCFDAFEFWLWGNIITNLNLVPNYGLINYYSISS
jgi:hypothetical protein